MSSKEYKVDRIVGSIPTLASIYLKKPKNPRILERKIRFYPQMRTFLPWWGGTCFAEESDSK